MTWYIAPGNSSRSLRGTGQEFGGARFSGQAKMVHFLRSDPGVGRSKVECFHRGRNHHPLSIPCSAAHEDERTPVVLLDAPAGCSFMV